MAFPLIQHTGIYFSGYFTYDAAIANKKQFEQAYSFSDFFESNKNYLSQKYYSNWLRTLYPDQDSLQNSGLRNFKGNHLVYLYPSPEKLVQKTANKEISFNVTGIDIFLFREGLAIFSINISLAPEFQNFNDISALTAALRNTMANDKVPMNNLLANLIETRITPFFTTDPLSWRVYNPHLKLFLNIDVKDNFKEDNEINDLLMELAMIIPPGTIKSKGLYAPSEKYSGQLFKENVIDIFNNWKAICLFDSLVRISVNLREADKHNLWETDYYNIYVFTSFIRFYLYKTNTRLSLFSQNVKESALLRNEFISFMNDFDLTQISYKFLPNIIYKSLLNSMEIKDELLRMEQKLSLIDTAVREHKERKIESFIKLIVFLTLFSILFDGVNLIIRQIGGDEKDVNTNRIVFGIVLLIVISVALFIFMRQRKNK
jgi:hypothetical protein